MNNLGTRVTDVNQVAEQLLSSDNCNKDQIHQTRDQLHNRSELTDLVKSRITFDMHVVSILA